MVKNYTGIMDKLIIFYSLFKIINIIIVIYYIMYSNINLWFYCVILPNITNCHLCLTYHHIAICLPIKCNQQIKHIKTYKCTLHIYLPLKSLNLNFLQFASFYLSYALSCEVPNVRWLVLTQNQVLQQPCSWVKWVTSMPSPVKKSSGTLSF